VHAVAEEADRSGRGGGERGIGGTSGEYGAADGRDCQVEAGLMSQR
jgi:hypothetical protein